MIKITALYRVTIAATLTALCGNIQAQTPATNRPATTAAVTPVVHTGAAYSAALPVNYVRAWDPVAPITDANALAPAPYTDVKQTTAYLDGLGRPLQTVSRQITRNAMDMVTPIEYDMLGREVYKYLPYVSSDNNGSFKMDPFNAQKTFMQGQYPDEQIYYGQTDFEASPLSRVTKTMAPGNNWTGSARGISYDYLTNNANDQVRIWTITSNALAYGTDNDVTINIPLTSAAYNAGDLFKNVSHDEAGNVAVEYKDKEDQVVLKKVQAGNIAADYSGHGGFLCTYFVYDDLHLLRFVIPPKAVAQMVQAGSWQLNNDQINELCFRYEYDNRKRLTGKKVPGAGWVYMIYDDANRMVFSQDANLRRNGQWITTLYDKLSRPVLTGITTYNSTPDVLQGIVNSQTAAASNPQESTIEGLTIFASPIPSTASFIALTKMHYDNYAWTNIGFSTAYNSMLQQTPGTDATKGYNLHPVDMPAAAYTGTQTMVTGSEVRVISDPANLAAGVWLTNVNFYDDRGRIIQINSQTQKGRDIITNRYDFTGKLIAGYLDHTNPSGTPSSVHVKTSLKYDHAGRLMEVWKTINDDDSKKTQIVANEYDELGQLKTKTLSPTGASNGGPLEVLNNDYNIRGWLTGINKDYANGAGAVNGVTPWFGMELNYDKGFNISQYTGSIAGTKWRSRGDGERRAYGFSYDNANRMLGADFTQFDGSAYTDNANINYDVVLGDASNGIAAYDENGNIQKMKQWGLKLNSSPVIDDLTYLYYNNGNKLSSVTDNAAPPAGSTGWGLGDFTDNHKNDNDYGYYENGNMVIDLNKKLTGTAAAGAQVTSGGAIIYNHMNLPWKINVQNDAGGSKGNISYIYDATGRKLQKIVFETGATVINNNQSYTTDITTTTSYVDGFVYESKSYSNSGLTSLQYNDKLQFFSHDEGRVRYLAALNSRPEHYEYDYFVKDHLGNVRLVLTSEQKQDIYPAATLEGSLSNASDAAYIENKFYNIDPAKIVDKTQEPVTGITDYINKNGGPAATDPPVNNNPNSNVTANSQKLYKLMANGGVGVTGLGITLKVMSGDRIDVYGKSYYFENNTNNLNYDVPVLDLLTGLLGAPTGATAGKAVTAQTLNSTTDVYNAVNGFLTDPNRGSVGTTPKAYINWILLDDNFKYITGSFDRVKQANVVEDHTLSNIQISKNGYLYVYVSNESPVRVFFDNLQVIHTHGALLEETHYYPFGLTMSGISSKALNGAPENKYKYNKGSELQNKEFSDGSGLELYSTQFRSLDPQLGRFWQLDPRPDYSQSLYSAMNNNPISFNDPLGDSILGKSNNAVADRIVSTANSKIAANDTKIANNNTAITNVRNQLASGTLSKKETKAANNTIADLTKTNTELANRNEDLRTGIAAIDAMKADLNNNYSFESPANDDGTHHVTQGKGKNVIVEGSNTGLFLHESVHILQHLNTGGLRFSANDNFKGLLLNVGATGTHIGDEVQAYQVQFSFDGTFSTSFARNLPDITPAAVRDLHDGDFYPYKDL